MLHKRRNITIAVLPFQINAEEDRVKNLFMGFVEDLITNFSKFIGLSVVSSLTTNQIKDISNQSEIDKLSTDFLTFGTVRHLNNSLRISIQLVKTEDNSVVFGEQYNETLDSLLEAQDKIVLQIVNVLQEKINYNLLSHSYKKNSVDLAAYENYLIGMNILKKGSGDNDTKARAYFNAALEIEPNYSPAYTGLSLSYFNFWSCLLWDRWEIGQKGSHQYALKAIEIDPNDYVALGVLGRTYVYMGEYEKAEHCLRKSLRMNANDVSNLLRVSYSLVFAGYADEAVILFQKALELNPGHSDLYYAYGSSYYLEAGDYEKSISLSKKAPIDSWTDFPAWIAAAYFHLEDYDNLWKYWAIYLEQFEKNVYVGEKSVEEEALDWMSIINPFKGLNKISPLVDYVRSHKQISSTPYKQIIDKRSASFQLEGDVWKMSYQESSIILKDAKGYHDIHTLLSHPAQEYHCLDFMGAAVSAANSIESIDQKAKAQYLKRIKELQADIDEAEEMNQVANIATLREEHDKLLDHLSQVLGVGGKTRKVGSTVEKARSAVTWRIRNALKKIGTSHPELGNHLSKSIKTGTYCAYKPEITVHWTL